MTDEGFELTFLDNNLCNSISDSRNTKTKCYHKLCENGNESFVFEETDHQV